VTSQAGREATQSDAKRCKAMQKRRAAFAATKHFSACLAPELSAAYAAAATPNHQLYGISFYQTFPR